MARKELVFISHELLYFITYTNCDLQDTVRTVPANILQQTFLLSNTEPNTSSLVLRGGATKFF
jgi:hypothetical protein